MKRRFSEQSRVSVFVSFVAAPGINTPPIADNEHNGLGHIRRTLPVINAMNKRSFVDNLELAHLHRPREVAQSNAGAVVPARICRPRHSVFSALGRPKTVWYHLVDWRGTRAASFGGDPRLCRSSGCKIGTRL